MGSAVDTAGISQQINSLREAGFGGVEVVPIYGAKGYEDRYLSYLAPGWMKMLDYTVETAGHAGMGVYISAGTGWPIGGPQVTAKDAATKLLMRQYAWNTDTAFNQIIAANDNSEIAALIAYRDNSFIRDITGELVMGRLNWQPREKGNYVLYALFNGKTSQKVKRAAPGGEGYVLDHFSATALPGYLKTYDTVFGKDLHGVKALYNDSYEVFDANWTPTFFNDFNRLRGYDLKPYVRQFMSDIDNDTVARIKTDYRETLSDLLLNNFTKTYTSWTHSKHALSLNQAHGSPGNLLDLYASVDIPECETFGINDFSIPGLRHDSVLANGDPPDPNMLKFASSAAHVTGKNLISCETFTWLGEHFKSSWAQCKPQLEEVFLAGVNHMFYHGTTYTPKKAGWPGWLFYASMNIVPNNSLWPHINALNDYIARCQSVLQAGHADNEIAVYWPVYDTWHDAKGMDMTFKVHDIDKWLRPTSFYTTVQSLQQHGFAVDYFSDNMLSKTTVKNNQLISEGNNAFKVLILPGAQFLPYITWQKILSLVKDGLTVITPGIQFKQPGLRGLSNDVAGLPGSIQFTASGSIQKAVIGKGQIILSDQATNALQYLNIRGETLPAIGLKFIRRKVADGKYYYVVNHTPNTLDTNVTLHCKAGGAIFLDPQSGKAGVVPFKQINDGTQLRLALQPGEAIIIQVSDKLLTGASWKYLSNESKNIQLVNAWKLHFKEGGPALPKDTTLLHPAAWTTSHDTTYQNFSGTGVYSTTIDMQKQADMAYELQIDSLYESARVIVNGKPAGYIWAIPYKLDISTFLQNGNNAISIEVANLMANRIRYLDRNGISWRNYHEINFVNIKYKPFDASSWQVMPSGIAGNVYIRETRQN